MRGLQTIFDPLQTAGTNDCEVSPFFGNNSAVCLTAVVSLIGQIRRELKESMWLSCLILTTLKEGEQEERGPGFMRYN